MAVLVVGHKSRSNSKKFPKISHPQGESGDRGASGMPGSQQNRRILDFEWVDQSLNGVTAVVLRGLHLPFTRCKLLLYGSNNGRCNCNSKN